MPSKRGSRARILLDTSFLLPVLGYEASKRVMKALPLLTRYELYYSELSLLEALWKISKMLAGLGVNERREALARIREGLEAIATGMERAEAGPGAPLRALEISPPRPPGHDRQHPLRHRHGAGAPLPNNR